MSPASGYAIVYVIEILLLLATVVAIGPLVRFTKPERAKRRRTSTSFPSSSFNSGVMQ